MNDGAIAPSRTAVPRGRTAVLAAPLFHEHQSFVVPLSLYPHMHCGST